LSFRTLRERPAEVWTPEVLGGEDRAARSHHGHGSRTPLLQGGTPCRLIHFDQVLEAFGCIPLFVLIFLASRSGKKIVVTVHETDPFQLLHKRFNRLYDKCADVLVYSENMKQQLWRWEHLPRTLKSYATVREFPNSHPQIASNTSIILADTISRGVRVTPNCSMLS
jgi:hypothetical protein